MAKFKEISNETGVFFFHCKGCKCDHSVYTRFANSLGAKWAFNGDVDKPTISPSLLVSWTQADPPITSENFDEYKRNPWTQTPVKKVCHSFITDGKIQYLNDSTHEFAGQTIELPELE